MDASAHPHPKDAEEETTETGARIVRPMDANVCGESLISGS
jgi:hypothetical protein